MTDSLQPPPYDGLGLESWESPDSYPILVSTPWLLKLGGLRSYWGCSPSQGTTHGSSNWRIAWLHRLVQLHYLSQEKEQEICLHNKVVSFCGCIGPCLCLPPAPNLVPASCLTPAFAPVPTMLDPYFSSSSSPHLQFSMTSPGSDPQLSFVVLV